MKIRVCNCGPSETLILCSDLFRKKISELGSTVTNFIICAVKIFVQTVMVIRISVFSAFAGELYISFFIGQSMSFKKRFKDN